MTVRCNKCGRRLEGQACNYCPDPAQRLLALQSRVATRPTPKKQPRAHWWTSQWRPKPKPETVSGQDAALPKGDR